MLVGKGAESNYDFLSNGERKGEVLLFEPFQQTVIQNVFRKVLHFLVELFGAWCLSRLK